MEMSPSRLLFGPQTASPRSREEVKTVRAREKVRRRDGPARQRIGLSSYQWSAPGVRAAAT
jgi:hypothetical protein